MNEKKIKQLSGACYNMGLEKAKIRDMSGAVIYLRKSLRFDKNNIDARNLLGLVYYEIGEVVDALAEWVISKNLQPVKNMCSRYLKEIKENEARLNEIEMSLSKYNQALHLVRQESYDLAVLQLKKVIDHYPKMMRAYQLLALLYMKQESYFKAEKILKEALYIDKTNTLCLQYYEELRKVATTKKKKAKKKKEPDFSNLERLSGDDVIIPTYKENDGGWAAVIYLLLGLVIGVAATYFLITPTIRQELSSQYNESVASYGDTIAQKDADITELQSQINALQSEQDSLNNNLEGVQNDNSMRAVYYDALINVLYTFYASDNPLDGIVAFMDLEVDLETVNSETYTNVYNAILNNISQEGITQLLQGGDEALRRGDIESGIKYFGICVELNSQNQEGIWGLARAYHQAGDTGNAAIYYTQLIDMRSSYANQAQVYLNQIQPAESQ